MMMKKITTPILIMAILAMGFSPASAQKANKKDEQFKEMVSLMEGGSYVFSVQSVQPTGARTIHTTSDYSLEAKDGIFKAYLPYFGRAYQASYGGNGGIEFEAQADQLEMSLNEKKRMIKIEFEVRTSEEKYVIFLSVGSSGFGTLSINSNNRQPISYSGIVGPLEGE